MYNKQSLLGKRKKKIKRYGNSFQRKSLGSKLLTKKKNLGFFEKNLTSINM